MSPIQEEIQKILNPNNSISIVKENRLYQLQPLLPLSCVLDLADDMDEIGQKKILLYLQQENVAIYNGIIYELKKGLNFEGRLKEIIALYHAHLRSVIGDKKILLDLYEKIPASDLANLTQDHVLFVKKKLWNSSKRALAAMRFVPSYDIHFEKNIYRMPGCTIIVFIDENLIFDNPEVLAEDEISLYEHPFVFRDRYKFGQKICMGSFSKSKEEQHFNRLRFANSLNFLIKQAVQILITGYNRSVSPANGHLGTSQYKKYLI